MKIIVKGTFQHKGEVLIFRSKKLANIVDEISKDGQRLLQNKARECYRLMANVVEDLIVKIKKDKI